MKITRIGWTWKTENPHIAIKEDLFDNGELEIVGVYDKKGDYDSWHANDWPPRKVRITVEDVKEKP